MQWYKSFLFFKFYYWFCHLDCHFLSIDAGCHGCHAWGRQCLFNPEHLVVLSAGPILHNSIHLLTITTDFVALYWFTGYVVFIITSFLAGVESGGQYLLNSKVLSCFSGVIMSIRSYFQFIFCKTNGVKKSQELHLSTCIQLRFLKHPSRKLIHFRHLLICGTIWCCYCNAFVKECLEKIFSFL